MKPIVKICGLTNAADAAFCARAGADWLGFIFHSGSPRRVGPERVAEFDTGPARRVGVFVDQKPEEALRIMAAARLDLAQLHGGQDRNFADQIGPERVIRVFWPQRYTYLDLLAKEMETWRESAHWYLLDAGQQGGGHGQPLNLAFLAGLTPPRPWLLAGGLTAERAAAVNPAEFPNLAGFDFNSGVERAPGLKDDRLARAAVQAVARHFQMREAERTTA